MLSKRLIAVNLSAAVLMAVMTGCGNTSAPASDPVSEQQSAEQTSEIPSQSADPEEQTEERESVPEEAMTTAVEAGQEEDQAPAEPEAFAQEKAAAIKALEDRMKQEREAVYVYKDFGLTANHFTQKAKMYGSDEDLVKDMDEDWREDPYSGTSCIRCEVTTAEDDWGGWLFLNGYLPKGETTPLLNDGSEGGQGLDLRGAGRLCFMARGENGGETVEFFTGGFGYDGVTNIGKNPTFGLRSRSIETFLLDADVDLYGREIRVAFIRMLRPEIRFSSPELLEKQIACDVSEAKTLLAGTENPFTDL